MNTIDMRMWAVLSLCAVGFACGGPPATTAKRGLSTTELVFLTRDGCANTPIMRANVDEALRSVSLQPSYAVVDLAALPEADARRGYPTPTLLYEGVDIFGMEQPTPPYPEPTWRIYPDGVPSAVEIEKRLAAIAKAN